MARCLGTASPFLSGAVDLRAIAFLARALTQVGVAARLASGVPEPGSPDPQRRVLGFWHHETWESHAWVVTSRFSVDITADQFSHAPVVVTSCPDALRRAGMDRQTILALSRAGSAVLDDLWTLWQRHPSAAHLERLARAMEA